MKASDCIGHFALWGDFDADAVTSRLGLVPSAVYPKGDTSLTGSPGLIGTWDLYCPEHLTTANEQVNYLLDLLWPHAAEIAELTARFHGDVNVVGGDVFCLEPAEMERLVKLNVTLNVFDPRDDADPFQGEVVSETLQSAGTGENA